MAEPLTASWSQRHRLGHIVTERNTGVHRPHHATVALRIHGPLHLPALDRAWRRLQERHSVLLCGFDLSTAIWRLAEPASPRGVIAHRSGIEESAMNAVERLKELVDEPFDVAFGPLSRLVVLHGPTESLLALVVDHLIADAWSLEILMRDLTTYYADEIGLPTQRLPQVSMTYPEHVKEENSYLDSPAGHNMLRKLSEILQDVGPMPQTKIPGFTGSVNATYYDTGIVRVNLEQSLAAAVIADARAMRMSPWTLIHAAVHSAIYDLTEQTAVGTALVTANRESMRIHQAIGFFAGKVIVRTRRDDRIATPDFLQDFQCAVFDALDYTEIPWARLVAHMDPTSFGQHSDVPYVTVNPHGATTERWLGTWHFSECTTEPLNFPGGAPDSAIVISLTETVRNISVEIHHRTGWYPTSAIETFWDTIERTLHKWTRG